MPESAEALEGAPERLATGKEACESATTELGLISADSSAEQVATHLGVASTRFAESAVVVQEALAKSTRR